MPHNEKRRQASLQRQASKRKAKTSSAVVSSSGGGNSRRNALAAMSWPIHECLLSASWQQEGQLIQAVVARRGPQGVIVAGVFLIDLGCLGVKSAFARRFASVAEYEYDLRDALTEQQLLLPAELNVIARIVQEGIIYARGLGFDPRHDYTEVAPILNGAAPETCTLHIPLGVNGKPLYVSGPNDNPRKVVATLDKTVGPGNYDYVVGLGFAGD